MFDKFTYSESSPTGLVYTETGKSAGYSNPNIGFRIRLNKKVWYVHRIIYHMFYGQIPDGMVIDHIDGNPFNNRIENLRCTTQAINTRNRCISKRNKTGITGVSVRSNGEVTARFMVGHNKVGYKSFSISKYGYEEAIRLAKNYRDMKMQELNLTGAGYSSRHLSH